MSFDPCSFLYQASANRNGETFEDTFGDLKALVVQGMDGANHVLRKNADNYQKELRLFRQVMGATRLTEDGTDWRRREVISQPYLARFDPDRLVAASHEHALVLVERLQRPKVAGRLEQFAIDATTMQVLTDTLLDGCMTNQADEIVSDVQIMLDYASSYAFTAHGARLHIDRDATRNLARAKQRMMTRLSAVRNELPPGDNILAALDRADRTGDAGIIFQHELMLLLAAGYDTTATALGWCCQALADNQDVQSAVRQEVSGLDAAQLSDPLIINQLPWLNGFVEETLRLFPPIPMLTRRAKSADTIDGHSVEPQQLVVVSLVGIHRDADCWPDANNFAAGRHGISGTRSARAIPFSTGPRICGGARFAMLGLKATMATLIKCLSFKPSGLDPGPFQWRITMRRQLGQPVSVQPLG